MGLRNGEYPSIATFWKISKVADNGKTCEVQISISKKNKQTNEYETDFNGFVRFCGEKMVAFAKTLQPKDKIDIDSFELTNKYDKEKKVTYYNVSVFAAKKHEFSGSNGTTHSTGEKKTSADDGFMKIPEGINEDELPFN